MATTPTRKDLATHLFSESQDISLLNIHAGVILFALATVILTETEKEFADAVCHFTETQWEKTRQKEKP